MAWCVRFIYITIQGISVKFGESDKHFKGYLVVFLGDTPAAAVAGGFKEGVGGAYRCCRTCMVKRADLCLQVKLHILQP